ncbi:YoaK family protein [Kribbella sp. NPDC050470]|uniref:YoaK family protein n=1 Tax=unclassified Kribbella TaxID=2644121 RepID=UPI0037B73F03
MQCAGSCGRTPRTRARARGFLAAFTFLAYDHVFANAMTGNVVLTGIALLSGQCGQVWWHVLPMLAFVAGVAAAESLRLPHLQAVIRRPAIACMAAEATCLMLAGTPTPRVLPARLMTLGISFVAALQNTAFRELRGKQYSSVMVTGNLRSASVSAFAGLFLGDRDKCLAAARLGVLCGAFLAGAAVAGWATPRLENRALWIVAGLLTLALVKCTGGRNRELAQSAQKNSNTRLVADADAAEPLAVVADPDVDLSVLLMNSRVADLPEGRVVDGHVHVGKVFLRELGDCWWSAEGHVCLGVEDPHRCLGKARFDDASRRDLRDPDQKRQDNAHAERHEHRGPAA